MSETSKKHLQHLNQIRGGIEALARSIAQLPTTSAFTIETGGVLSAAYHRDTPFVARTAAGLLDKYRSTLCVRVPFDGAFLLQNEGEVQALTDIKAVADTVSAWAARALGGSKTALARNTALVVGQFDSFLGNPALSEQEARTVRVDCAPLFSRIEARREAIQSAKQDRAGLRAETAAAQQESDRLAAENRTLRGGAAAPEPQPTAPRRGRRTTRR